MATKKQLRKQVRHLKDLNKALQDDLEETLEGWAHRYTNLYNAHEALLANQPSIPEEPVLVSFERRIETLQDMVWRAWTDRFEMEQELGLVKEWNQTLLEQKGHAFAELDIAKAEHRALAAERDHWKAIAEGCG